MADGLNGCIYFWNDLFLLTVTRIRQVLLEAVPDPLKHAITVGIGLFITIIGLKNSGLLSVSVETVHDIPKGSFTPLLGFETVFGLGSFSNPDVLLTIIGLTLISILMVLNVRGAILFGILGTTMVALLVGRVHAGALEQGKWIPNLTKLNFFEFDFAGIMGVGIVPIILTFTFVELFDTFGTLVGTANRAGFMRNRQEGNKRVGKAMFVDSVAVAGGAAVGTSTVTVFTESFTGIAEGGRTGLTSVVTGICFLLSLVLAPVIALIPSSATAAALIVVGALMIQEVSEINFKDLVIGIPTFITIVFMPFTYSIANGISLGILSYVLLAFVANVFGGRQKYEIHGLMWVLSVLIVVRYITVGG